MIIACTSHRLDRRLLDVRKKFEDVIVRLSLTDAVARAREIDTRALVVDCAAIPGCLPGEMTGLLANGGLTCHIIVRFDPVSAGVLELYHLSKIALDIHDSCRSLEWDAGWLDEVALSLGPTAVFAMLRRIDHFVPTTLRGVMAAAAVLCSRVERESVVASGLGLSDSGLRRIMSRTRNAGLIVPSFPTLNATVLALHLAWNRERLNMGAGQAARRAGFATSRTCDHYLTYHLGKTARQILLAGGTSMLLGEMERWFRPKDRA